MRSNGGRSPIHCRIGQPGAVHPVPDRHLLVTMNEGRIGENRDPAITDQDGGIADKLNGALRRRRGPLLRR